MNSTIAARMRRSAITLPAAAIAAIFVLFLNEFSYQQSRASLIQIANRTDAIHQTEALLRRLVDAESGQRGFLLTGRQDYLKPYDEAAKDIAAMLSKLQQHYEKDPISKNLVSAITDKSQQKLTELEVTLQLYRQGREEAWKTVLLTDIGREKMEELRAATKALADREESLSNMGQSDLIDTLLINRVGICALTVLGLIGLIVFLRQTRAVDSMRELHDQELRSERDSLQRQVLDRTAELTELAKYLQSAREDEKAKLSRELHDELGALLTASKLDISRLKRSLGDISPEVASRLDHLSATINSGIGLKRRIIEDLRPSSLSNLGLLAALQIQLREFAERSELKVTSNLEDVSLGPNEDIVVYRFVQEALTNIAKYAKASSVHVVFQRTPEGVYLAVRDNGVGLSAPLNSRGAHGLLGMRYRLESINGRMNIQSERGAGTTVEAWIPLAA